VKNEAAVDPVRRDRGQRVEQQEIAVLAYEFWQARGCPNGSPEEDWFRAEQELQSRKSKLISASASSS
jgi:hypothetical protein